MPLASITVKNVIVPTKELIHGKATLRCCMSLKAQQVSVLAELTPSIQQIPYIGALSKKQL